MNSCEKKGCLSKQESKLFRDAIEDNIICIHMIYNIIHIYMIYIYIYYILYGGVMKRGSLERLPFTSMTFPAIPRFLLIFFVDFPPATFDDTGGLV
jgi:hypothetical protein